MTFVAYRFFGGALLSAVRRWLPTPCTTLWSGGAPRKLVSWLQPSRLSASFYTELQVTL